MTPPPIQATVMDRRTVEALVRAWPGYAVLTDRNGSWYLASNALRTRLANHALADAWELTLAELVRVAVSDSTSRVEVGPATGANLRMSAVISRLETSDDVSLLLVAFDDQQTDTPLPEDVRHRTRDQSVARLVSGFVHDFNNLLTVMLGVIDNLHGEAENYPERREDLAELSRSALAATSLTRQLLAFSRRRHSAPTLFGIDTMLRANQKLLRRVLGETLALTLALDSADAPVNLDPTDFDDVLVDLLGAARDSLPLGGTVQIRTARRPGADGGDVVLVHVDAQHSVTQGERSHGALPARRDLAVGSFTRALVERYGGHLHVTAHPGCSAAIELALPIAVTAEAHASGSSDTGLRPLRILVVEDDDFLLRYVTTTLRKAGHDVTTAASGTAAVDELTGGGHEFDLLLTDVVLPGAPGPVVWESFRHRHPGSQVLFMSGYTVDVVTSVGDRPLLSKPFSARQLLAAVDEARSSTSRPDEVRLQ